MKVTVREMKGTRLMVTDILISIAYRVHLSRAFHGVRYLYRVHGHSQFDINWQSELRSVWSSLIVSRKSLLKLL